MALAIALGATGFLTGMVAPSRDMLVRAASPAGAEGRTFGIVSTGFNVGGVIGPILFGFFWIADWPAVCCGRLLVSWRLPPLSFYYRNDICE